MYQEIVCFVICTLLIFGCILGSIVGTSAFINSNACNREASIIHLKTSWGFFEGCTIRLNDGQILTQTQFDSFYNVNENQ